MKFECEKKEFLNCVSLIKRVLINNKLSTLSNLLLEIDSNKAIIYGCNLKTYIKTDFIIENKEGKNESIYLLSDKLHQILSKIDSNIIICSYKDNLFMITDEKRKSKYKLIVDSYNKEYPVFPEVNNSICAIFDQKELKYMIINTIYATEIDGYLYTSGVYIKMDSNKLSIVSTDGRRLAYISRNNKNKEVIRAIIPIEILKIIIDYLNEGELKVYLNDKYIYFNFNNYEFYSSLIEAVYPNNYEMFIEEKNNQQFKLEINTNDFKNALDRISILIQENILHLFINKEQIIVSTGNTIYGNAEENIDCIFNGDDIEIIFNYQYIMDFLREEKSDKVIFEFNSSHDKVFIHNNEDENKIYIVVPIIKNKKD